MTYKIQYFWKIYSCNKLILIGLKNQKILKNYFFLKNSFSMIYNVYKVVILEKKIFDFKWADYSGVYGSILIKTLKVTNYKYGKFQNYY